jgi:hypothetical protein
VEAPSESRFNSPATISGPGREECTSPIKGMRDRGPPGLQRSNATLGARSGISLGRADPENPLVGAHGHSTTGQHQPWLSAPGRTDQAIESQSVRAKLDPAGEGNCHKPLRIEMGFNRHFLADGSALVFPSSKAAKEADDDVFVDPTTVERQGNGSDNRTNLRGNRGGFSLAHKQHPGYVQLEIFSRPLSRS